MVQMMSSTVDFLIFHIILIHVGSYVSEILTLIVETPGSTTSGMHRIILCIVHQNSVGFVLEGLVHFKHGFIVVVHGV